MQLGRDQLGAKISRELVDIAAARQLVKRHAGTRDREHVRTVTAQRVFEQHRSVIENFLLHIPERQRLVAGQGRVFWAGSANLVFDLIEFRLQLVEFVFEIGRLLFLITRKRNTGELLGDLLLTIEVVLLLLK